MKFIGPDLIIVAGLWTLAVISAVISYQIGGNVWKTLFRLRAKDGAIGHRGEWGEVANITAIAGILTMLIPLTPNASIFRFWVSYPSITISMAIICFIGFQAYAFFAVHSKKTSGFGEINLENTPSNIKFLRSGYLPYSGYGATLMFIMLMIITQIFQQIVADGNEFSAIQLEITQLLENIAVRTDLTAHELQNSLEVIYGKSILAGTYIIGQVNTVLLLLFLALCADLLANSKNFRTMFDPTALSLLRLITIAAALGAAIFATYIFVKTHLTFVDGVLDGIAQFETRIIGAPWEITQRYYQLLAELTNKRGVFGFLLNLTTGRGGLLLLFPIAKWLLDKQKAHTTQDPAKG